MFSPRNLLIPPTNAQLYGHNKKIEHSDNSLTFLSNKSTHSRYKITKRPKAEQSTFHLIKTLLTTK